MLREIREFVSYHKNYGRRFAEHDCKNVFEKFRKDIISFGLKTLEGKKILDLGCGQRFPFSLQCAAEGVAVTALDLDYVSPDFLPVAFYRTAKHNGLKRACKSFVRRLLFDQRYYKYLEKAAAKPLRDYEANINFVMSDPASNNYPLPEASFDLIVSNAVIEHVEDVSQVASEICRLLRKEGIFHGIIHNYYSLSGGHNLKWAFPDENPARNAPPWDHLRENRFPNRVPLNRLRPEEYQKSFSDYLDILLFEGRDINHDPGNFEGEKFLTPDIEKELHEYSIDLLLTRSFCIICKKSNL